MNTTMRRVAATAAASALGITLGLQAGRTDRPAPTPSGTGRCSVILTHPTGHLWACSGSSDTIWVPAKRKAATR